MHPILFHLGPITIYAYGFMLLLAFLFGEVVAEREAKRRGLSPGVVLDLALWILVFSLVFARLVFILLEPADFLASPISAFFARGGLSFHGGVIGGVLAGWLFARRRKLSFLALADVVTPSIALGYGIARIGCLLNGCCYGVPTTLPWGVRFPDLPGPVHPTQLYDSLLSFAVFGFLWMIRRKPFAPGQFFFLYLAIYSVERAIVEIFRRGASSTIWFDALTYAQVASFAIIALSVFLFVRLGKRTAKA